MHQILFTVLVGKSIKLKKCKGAEKQDSDVIGSDGDPDFYRMSAISPVPGSWLKIDCKGNEYKSEQGNKKQK